MTPEIMAYVEAVGWCEAVLHQCRYVADRRADLEGALKTLDRVVTRAERAIAEVRAIKAVKEQANANGSRP